MREHDRHRIVVTGSQSMMIFRAMYPASLVVTVSARSCLSRTVYRVCCKYIPCINNSVKGAPYDVETAIPPAASLFDGTGV